MKDNELLTRLAESNAYDAETPLPEAVWSRHRALRAIERRIGMRTSDANNERSKADQPLDVKSITPTDSPALKRPLRAHSNKRIGRVVLAAAAAAVVAVGGVLLAISRGGSHTVSGGEIPVDVVDAFFARWKGGDADAAMALVDPEVLVGTQTDVLDELRRLIVWTNEFNGRMETDCRQGTGDGRVRCDWAWRTAGTEAMGLRGSVGDNAIGFSVTDGVITRMGAPTYRAFEIPLVGFVQKQDPAGYEAACSPDGTSPVSSMGFARNARCGSFLAAAEPAFVASLDE